MDELVRHCIREISFDGDLGSNVSRLHDFIRDFYDKGEARQQTLDDAFYAFAWVLIVRPPSVRIGTRPKGITSDVYVPPQAKAKDAEVTAPPELDLIENAKNRTLDDLRAEYGDELRIAVDSEGVYAAITGSHIRPKAMSPMIYAALQIITRGRDNGVSIVDLGKQTGYDQKTCFYLVKKLTELNLVVKVRRGGVGTNFALHKHFYDNDPSWKAIREEEANVDTAIQVAQSQSLDADPETTDWASLGFTPITEKSLASLDLIRGRVVKLLQMSRNHAHQSNNLLLRIGFQNPTKTQRRFFTTRMRELIQNGVIEAIKIMTPSKRWVKCYRLPPTSGEANSAKDIVILHQNDEVEEPDEDDELKFHVTLQKQVMDLLEESDTAGMTLNGLAARLVNFDRRIIELFLERADKRTPPSHLSDLGIFIIKETYGRERRNRYFSMNGYRRLVQQENLDEKKAGLNAVDLSNTGGFTVHDPAAFYKDEAALHDYQDEIYDLMQASTGTAKKKRANKNPMLLDGSKRGRSKKTPAEPESHIISRNSKKRKRDEDNDLEDVALSTRPAKKVKGKQAPSTARLNQEDPVSGHAPSRPSMQITGVSEEENVLVEAVLPPKRRGRPPKIQPVVTDAPVKTPKKRGRPPKNKDIPARSSKRTKLDEPDVVAPPAAQTDDTRVATPAPEPRNASLGPLAPLTTESDFLDTGSPHPESAGSISMLAQVVENNVSASRSEQRQANSEAAPPFAEEGSATHGSSPPMKEAVVTNLMSSDSAASVSAPFIPIDPALLGEGGADDQRYSSQVDSQGGAQGRVTLRRTTANVSHMRREKEILRVIQEMGGAVNVSTKDLSEAHMRLIKTLADAGEPISTPPGTLIDKRTVASTLSDLEASGLVKTVKTAVLTRTGIMRPATVAYLPDMPQAELSAYLANLSENVPLQGSESVKRIETPLEFSAVTGIGSRAAPPLQMLQKRQSSDKADERWTRNTDRAEQLWAFDDDYIRSVLLTEHTTVAQYYGYLVGKAARLRKFHLETLRALETTDDVSSIVSRDHRIVHLSYFYQDIPAGLYFTFVAATGFEEGLSEFLSTPEGRSTSIRNIPANLHAALQIGRARSRSRILDLLVFLIDLKIVTPLRESISDDPFIAVSGSEGHPSAYDQASMEGWTVSKPTLAPQYWHFNAVAPLFRLRESMVTPPFIDNVSIFSYADASLFWRQFQDACLNESPDVMFLEHPSDSTASLMQNQALCKSLCRASSWNEEYVLTWFQQACMKHFAGVLPSSAPQRLHLDGDLLRRLSFLVSAPQHVVQAYLEKTKKYFAQEFRRVRQRKRKESAQTPEERLAGDKAELAQRAAEARSQREATWDAMMTRVHPGPLETSAEPRVRKVRERFLESSGQDLGKWEELINSAIKDAAFASSKLLKPRKRAKKAKAMATITSRPSGPSPAPPPVVMNPQDKSVEELIARQGPPLASTNPRRKRKDKEENPAKNGPVKYRRTRFPWDHDYEELARDAMVIIQARCRDLPRLELAALDQVFPAVPRNTVRQRHAAVRDAPGNEAYLKRLEEKWYELWVKHRGTAELPDEDIHSASDFDLVKHITFLRQHIDKNALRVGYVDVAAKIVIPPTVDELLEKWEVVEPTAAAPTWDFMWRGDGEEGREKGLAQLAFTKGYDCPQFPDVPDLRCLAETALKMTMGTPNDRYDPRAASHMLTCIGQEPVADATKNLLNRGVLSKLVRDPTRDKPGRRLKISDMNQNALGGAVPIDTFQDAAALEEVISSQETENWREWPLLATDGDLAALLQLASENKVDFNVDTSNARAARAEVDWNSKKADDDQLETRIDVKFAVSSVYETSSSQSSPAFSAMEIDVDAPDSVAHGSTQDSDPACCRQTVAEGLVDCEGCLGSQLKTLLGSIPEDKSAQVSVALNRLQQAGKEGASKRDLLTIVGGPEDEVLAAVRHLTELPVPLAFWTGYSELVLVASRYLNSWSVVVREEPLTKILPRRWIDISGNKMTDVWEAAIRAVIGLIIFRPGISQAELRWRLRSVYDRQEVSEVLRCLQEEGFVKILSPEDIRRQETCRRGITWLDNQEEKMAFCFVDNSRHWYLV